MNNKRLNNYAILTVITMFFFGMTKVSAIKVDYGTCVYKSSDGTRTTTVYLSSEGVSSNTTPQIKAEVNCHETVRSTNIKLDDYKNNGKFDCSMVPTISINSSYKNTTGGANRGRKCTYSTNKGDGGNKAVLNLDISSSKIIYEDKNQAEEEVKDQIREEYSHVCESNSAIVYIDCDTKKYKGAKKGNIDCSIQGDGNLSFLVEDYFEHDCTCPLALSVKKITKQSESLCWYSWSYDANRTNENNMASNELFEGNYTCGMIQNFVQQAQNLKESYESGDNTSNSVFLYQKKQLRETIKTYCQRVFKIISYDSPTKCVQDCVNVLDEYESMLDIQIGDVKCGFSSRLLLFIGNIVKWLKYIMPVFIMALSIIDFIKAIANDKEDEMKKAQKRFIIRLVVAVLIFIIPFIVEFILNVFGFDKYIDGCGIFDI